MDCRAFIVDRIRQSGPLTAADYIDLALYAPGLGYYARAAQRSGRTGDFVTSVDTGPLFGALLAVRIAAIARQAPPDGPGGTFDLVEAGAGNGRLTRDILDALRARFADVYSRARVTLVERSESARAAHATTLADHAGIDWYTRPDVPAGISGVVYCNELLDAMPVHVVIAEGGGLREVYVAADADGRLAETTGPLSTPELAAYFERLGLTLEPGSRADVNLAALAWIRTTAAALTRGHLIVIDYGRPARQLYGSAHAGSTLRAYASHVVDPVGEPSQEPAPPWLVDPGQRDLTTHVDITSVRAEAERGGLVTVADTDQSRYLLGLAVDSGLMASLEAPDRLADRLALKTLLTPEGLGTAFRVLEFARP